jgi:hypothetical protein
MQPLQTAELPQPGCVAAVKHYSGAVAIPLIHRCLDIQDRKAIWQMCKRLVHDSPQCVVSQEILQVDFLQLLQLAQSLQHWSFKAPLMYTDVRELLKVRQSST